MLDNQQSIILPYVCMKAVRHVREHLPVPTTCNCCGSPVRLTLNAEVYGKSFGEWPYLYICRNKQCKATVGLHNKTDLPLGTLATKETRAARSECKPYFLTLTNVKFKNNKNKSYGWLAGKLGINKKLCHWGYFDAETCRKAKKLCVDELEKVLK